MIGGEDLLRFFRGFCSHLFVELLGHIFNYVDESRIIVQNDFSNYAQVNDQKRSVFLNKGDLH